MDQHTMETISAAYTAYTLLNPADRVVVSIDSFAEAFKANLLALENTEGEARKVVSSEQLSEAQAQETLTKGMGEAEATLDDKEKLSAMLDKLKKKMKSLPMVGSVLSNVPTMFRLLNSYLKGEYTDMPRKQLILVVSALSYLISPIDLVPDFIPVVGLLDDIAIVSVCIKATQRELERYLAWRSSNNASDPDAQDVY